MFMFKCSVKLHHDFRKIPKWKFREFLKWGTDNPQEVPPVSEVPVSNSTDFVIPITPMNMPLSVLESRKSP